MAQLFQRKFSQRELLLMFLVALTLIGGLIYRYPYAIAENRISSLMANTDATNKSIVALSQQIADLKARAADIKAGAQGWQLVDQKGVILILEDVSAEARRQGVSLVSVHPSPEIVKDNHKEVTVSLDLKGRYRELAEYFKHIENQSRLVNIRKLRVEACPDSSSSCATQLEAVTYMAK
ncbi:MAG TPA: type 4a pilus biogenesis protein PilO [Nitrospirota bacterium]|nr:type 4a pilus biogenesis protein PilO [Nitrospirota bacterium]